LGGNSECIENKSDAKTRAKIGAELLENDAMENGKTLLVAHGFLNRYLEKYLNKRGWTTVFDGGNDYLSQKLLVRCNP
jgi:hypothetical protein